jgi:prophage maintenance system killer protein
MEIMITSESVNAVNKIESALADLRVNADSVAEQLSRSSLEIQQRVFDLATSYLRYLSSQHMAGAYINGNIEIAHKANQIREGYGI